jgi:hypothetical protein
MDDVKRTCPVSADDREQLRKIVSERGESRAIELTRIPRSTLGRVLAELPVRAGTRIALRQALHELAAGGRVG